MCSQTLNNKSIGSRISSLDRSARKPGKIRGIRYTKPRCLCDKLPLELLPVKRLKAWRLCDETPSKISPLKIPRTFKETESNCAAVQTLLCVTPWSVVCP